MLFDWCFRLWAQLPHRLDTFFFYHLSLPAFSIRVAESVEAVCDLTDCISQLSTRVALVFWNIFWNDGLKLWLKLRGSASIPTAFKWYQNSIQCGIYRNGISFDSDLNQSFISRKCLIDWTGNIKAVMDAGGNWFFPYSQKVSGSIPAAVISFSMIMNVSIKNFLVYIQVLSLNRLGKKISDRFNLKNGRFGRLLVSSLLGISGKSRDRIPPLPISFSTVKNALFRNICHKMESESFNQLSSIFWSIKLEKIKAVKDRRSEFWVNMVPGSNPVEANFFFNNQKCSLPEIFPINLNLSHLTGSIKNFPIDWIENP